MCPAFAVAFQPPVSSQTGQVFGGHGVLGRHAAHGLFNLAHNGVAQHQHGVGVLEGQSKGAEHEIVAFLRRGRGQHQIAVVAVAAALDGLKIIAL